MRKLAVVVLLFMFAGCATTKIKPAPVFEISKGSKVGVINLVGQKMNHYHVGTTIFNNFEKEYDVPWDIPDFINKEITKQAAEIGYPVAIIKAGDDFKNSVSNCTEIQKDQIVLKSDTISIFEKLANDHNLSMIYIIKEAEAPIMIPNTYVNAKGYGVGTRNFLAIGSASAFVVLEANAIYLDPVSVTRGTKCIHQEDISGFKMIGNFRNLSDEQLTKVSDEIKLFINKFISDLLINSNLQA